MTCQDCPRGTAEKDLCGYCLLRFHEIRAGEALESLASDLADKADELSTHALGRHLIYVLVTQKPPEGLVEALRYALPPLPEEIREPEPWPDRTTAWSDRAPEEKAEKRS